MFKAQIKKYMPIPWWKALSNINMALDAFNTTIILKLAGSDLKFFKFFIRNKYKKIIWLDTLMPEFVFVKDVDVKIYEPKYNASQKLIKVTKPKICLYEFENAKVHCESSHVLLESSIVMERLPHVLLDYCNYSNVFVNGHDNIFSVQKRKYQFIEIDKAFFLGGNGSWNYYHWTIEIIPKLKYFLSLNLNTENIKIILPAHVKHIKSFSVMLEILLGSRFDFVYISKDQIAKVQKLYIVTTPSNIVFNPRKNANFGADFLYFDKISIDFLRNSILFSSQYKLFLKTYKNKFEGKKIFLARKEQLSRQYNQNDVKNLVAKYGFVSVFLEELSFFEQIYLFQNIEFLIGASGAAWTNLIYVNKGVKAISWLSENLCSFSSYSTLAKYYDCDLTFFECKVNDKRNIHSKYSVDLICLENLIKKSMS